MFNSLFIGNRDGGIINTITQAPKSDDPVVVIGLGGTGVDTISRLKTKLHRQIKPDNEDAVEKNGDMPRYDNIKFLGIDADSGWLENSGLEQGERLNIQDTTFPVIFASATLEALRRQPKLKWMSIDYVAQHLPPTADGAGAYRQFGRWLTIHRANTIKSSITEVITQACMGRIGGSLNVHIVAGISGGMGSGSFVDICYIVREVINGLGFDAANVFGYFVLPDAIISKPGILGDPIKTSANQKNGMAALLEIEHLMNLEDSNEWFEQDYGEFSIRTQHKLVDMCHFISSTNIDGTPIPNGYEYALNVIGDYILAFISKEVVTNGSTPITMSGNLNNIVAHVDGIDPKNGYGYSQKYTIIGSANGEIPMTQMATYLASKLFERFTIRTDLPNKIQIQQEFADYLHLSDQHFNSIVNQISSGANWIGIDEKLVSQYFDQIEAHMNDNTLPGAMINPTVNSMNQRKGVLLQNREAMAQEFADYRYQVNADSIPGLAFNKLLEIINDPNKGPIYAYGMMNKTGVDIFHYLNGRLRYCTQQRQHAQAQKLGFMNKEPEAKKNLGNSGFLKLGKGKCIKEYASTLNSRYYWEAQEDLYTELVNLITNLQVTFNSINDNYLRPLKNITEELLETFEANSNYFQLGNGDESQDGFTKQLVKFSNIKPQLDISINATVPRDETAGLLQILTEHPDIWMTKEERKIKAKISDYILNKFNPILSQSLEDCLRTNLKMQGATLNLFAKAIENQIILPLVNDAAPILWTNGTIVTDNTATAHRTILTVPSGANIICNAANQYVVAVKKTATVAEVRASLINDRIYVLRTISGVPMHVYLGLVQYLGTYNSYNGLGLHMYERNINWRETLTFPYPYSLNPQYTKNAQELLSLYNDAVSKGIIYFNGTNAFVKKMNDIDPALLDIEGIRVNGRIDQNLANQRIKALQEILASNNGNIAINSKGNVPVYNNSVIKDNFLRFYGIQQAVRKEVEKYDSLNNAIEEINMAVVNTQNADALKKTLFVAFLVDLFADDGFTISYDYVEFNMQKVAILCNNTMPYADLSKYYQVFESMQTLDDSIRNEIAKEANTKFEAMNNVDKLKKVMTLLNNYNPQMLSLISENYTGRIEQNQIDAFYLSFVQYLNRLRIQLNMAGVNLDN